MKNTQTNNTKKDTSRLTKAICAAIGVVLIILAILLSLRGCAEDGSASAHSSGNIIGNPGIIYDTGAVEGGWDEADTESIVASLNEKVEEGMINISMNTSPNFPNGTSAGNLMIVNESINRYPQIVEITRNDTGEVIYKSGAIPVGSKIEAAKLSVDLDAGMYECTAMFYNVDPNTGNYLGCAGAIIHLTVVE